MSGLPSRLLGGRFQLGDVVGRGAAGVVFAARDEATGRRVAVKRLHPHLVGTVGQERIAREARLLAAIDSPYVVKLVAHAVDDDGCPCLVLEWLDGEDLARRMRTRPLRRSQIFDVVWQAAVALGQLHAAGIVHRDVKPSNFFVHDGAESKVHLKLLDLGIARRGHDTELTVEGVAIGTPAYMAPEQARGEEDVGPTADVFSIGVMTFELLAGKKPYTGEDVFAMLAQIVLREPPRLGAALPGIEAEIDELVRRAMAKLPEDRFADGAALAEAILELPEPTGLVGKPRVDDGDSPSAVVARASLSTTLEQRVVSAVFAGLGGCEPDAMDRLAAIAAAHGGAFHKTLGRRAVVVFGGAVTRGDEVLRAARAGLDASKIAGARLAIVTGQAVADGRELAGNAIERGAVEVDRAAAGGVRVDEPSARLLSAHFRVEGPVGDRLLAGARAAEEAAAPRLLGQATPMVGRDRELASLEATLEQSIDESVARAVLVTAPAGAGKSRLRYELLRRVRDKHPEVTVLVGRADSLSAGAPFGLIAPPLRRLAGILDGEPLDARRAKLRALLARRVQADALERCVAFLGELIGASPADVSDALRGARQNAVILGDAMRAAWQDWLAAECAHAPVLLVLEDLHWGDLPSVSFVDDALRVLSDRRLMVLALARPEVRAVFPTLWASRAVDEIRLAPIGKKACETLVRVTLGARASNEVVQQIVERADGNAFFLEELIRGLGEGGAGALPDTVLGMVQARLDALGPDARRVLRAGSVFGATFWRGGVEALLGHTPDLDGVLERLVARELVSRRPTSTVANETELVFRHALVRDGAYAMLADADRAVGHRLAGEWLEANGFAEPVALAQHYVLGEQPLRAAGWFERAAAQALEGNDLVAAIERAERGVACDPPRERLGALRIIQTEAHRWRGELAVSERRGLEAMAALERGSAAWLRASVEVLGVVGLLGHTDRVEAMLREVEALPFDPETASLRVASLCRGAIWLLWAGRHDAAAERFTRVDELAAGDALAGFDHLAQALVHFAWATRALHTGNPARHLAEQRQAMYAFEAGGDLRNACSRRVAVGFALAELGMYAEAERELRGALFAADRMGLGNIRVRAENNLGHVLCRLGRVGEALEIEQRAVDACVVQGDPRLEAASRVYLAMILEALGDAAGAEREAGTAAVLAKAAPASRSFALALQARAQLAQGRVAEALGSARDGAALLEELGQLDEGDAIVRLALASCLEAARDPIAPEAFARAAARVRERAAAIHDAPARAAFLAITENAETLRRAPR